MMNKNKIFDNRVLELSEKLIKEPEYIQESNKVDELEEKLSELLNEAENELLEKLVAQIYLVSGMASDFYYKHGFIDGVREGSV
jgi:hypothetical protein